MVTPILCRLWVWQEMGMVDSAFPSLQYNGASCLPAVGVRDHPPRECRQWEPRQGRSSQGLQQAESVLHK